MQAAFIYVQKLSAALFYSPVLSTTHCTVSVQSSAVASWYGLQKCDQCGAAPLLHSSPSQKQYVDPAW